MKPRTFAILLTLIAVVRIASTYTVFSQTADEPAHIAAGMEVLVQHRYTLHIENTPLPRIVLALVPWLSGSDFRTDGTIVERGNSVIYWGHHYQTNLVRTRIGNLLFFIIAAAFTWLWSRDALGEGPALAALFLFTTQPVILGFAGLATTDIAAVAGVAAALYAWWRWLESPSIGSAIAAGVAYGFALNCKQSALIFVPVAAFAMWLVRLIERRAPRLPNLWHVPLMSVVAAFLIWAGYGFSVGPMSSVEPVPAFVPPFLANMPIFAPRLFRGIVKLMEVDRNGFPAYLFGRSSMHGWWWYFPAALLLKSTLASLIAVFVALGARLRAAAAPAAAALAILLFVMTTHVDVGVRYALPIYVPLSLAGGAAIAYLWSRQRAFAVVLIAWQLLTGLSHPDYFPYFNELAGRHPDRYLLDSNLDWGQDLLRLERELKRRNVQELGLKYFGPADLTRHRLPHWTELDPNRPMKGWVAISELWYHGVWYDGYHENRYPWLVNEKPVARVGKSIRLYYIH